VNKRTSRLTLGLKSKPEQQSVDATDMQKQQAQVRELLKIKNAQQRHEALREFAKRAKEEFSSEPDTEVLNLSLMRPKFMASSVVKKATAESLLNEKIKTAEAAKPFRRKLKDSIYFKTDEEYEEYLHATLEKEGLFAELYEQFKVLYVSRKNIPALTSIWTHLDQLGLNVYQACLEQAEVLIQMEEMEKAFVFLDRAVRMEPDDIIGVRAISLYHKLAREYELAIHWMEKWKKLRHDDAEVYYHMGSVYRRTGMKDMAIMHLRRCLNFDHNHIMARSLLEKLGQ